MSTASVTAVVAFSTAVLLLYRGRGTVLTYLNRTLSDRLSGATVESTVSGSLETAFQHLVLQVGGASAVLLLAVVAVIRLRAPEPGPAARRRPAWRR